MILAGTLTGVQGDIQCKVLAALSTIKYRVATDLENLEKSGNLKESSESQRFLKCVIESRFAEIVKIANTRISN